MSRFKFPLTETQRLIVRGAIGDDVFLSDTYEDEDRFVIVAQVRLLEGQGDPMEVEGCLLTGHAALDAAVAIWPFTLDRLEADNA